MAKEIIEYSNYAEYLRIMEHKAQERRAEARAAQRAVPKAKLGTATPEAEIQREILQWLKSRGIFCWRQNTQGQIMHGKGGAFMKESTAPGASDIIGVLPDGRALCIEVKASDWRPPRPETVERATVEYDRGDTKTDRYKTFRAQREFQRRALAQSAMVIVATSLDDVRSRVTGYLSEARAQLSALDPRFTKTIDCYYRESQRGRGNSDRGGDE